MVSFLQSSRLRVDCCLSPSSTGDRESGPPERPKMKLTDYDLRVLRILLLRSRNNTPVILTDDEVSAIDRATHD
jgi:hypothetical protein